MVLSSIGKFNYYELSWRVFEVEKSNYSIHVCPSVHPQETFELPLDGFS
jgi:hypothetical protein